MHGVNVFIILAMIVVGLVNLLIPQVIVASRDWWRQFREENFPPDLSDFSFRRRRRPPTASDYRFAGGGLIVLAVLLWWFAR